MSNNNEKYYKVRGGFADGNTLKGPPLIEADDTVIFIDPVGLEARYLLTREEDYYLYVFDNTCESALDEQKELWIARNEQITSKKREQK